MDSGFASLLARVRLRDPEVDSWVVTPEGRGWDRTYQVHVADYVRREDWEVPFKCGISRASAVPMIRFLEITERLHPTSLETAMICSGCFGGD